MVEQALGKSDTRSLEHELQSFHPSSFGWALLCCRWDREEAEEVLQACAYEENLIPAHSFSHARGMGDPRSEC